jgi:hypothetical protein
VRASDSEPANLEGKNHALVGWTASPSNVSKAVDDSFYFPFPISTDKKNVLARADKAPSAAISAIHCCDGAIAHQLVDTHVQFAEVALRPLGRTNERFPGRNNSITTVVLSS